MMKTLFDYIIKQGGAISYSQYMNLALYHPVLGYYSKNKQKIGRNGDFYTSSHVSNVFGKLFAKYFAELVERDEVNPSFCEIGGGTGRFLAEMLDEWKRISPETYSNLNVFTIEKSGYHRELQVDQAESHAITVIPSIDKLSRPYSGIIFSNELFDAFPVEVIENRDSILYEVYITFNQNNDLVEKLMPLTNRKIIQYLKWQEIELLEGQRYEIPLKMLEYMDKLNECTERAVIVTVDYGYTNREWQHPARLKGSMRGYYRHQMMHPLQHPFDMDITTHIHFDALEKRAEEFGWNLLESERQDDFLLKAGILAFLKDNDELNPFGAIATQNRAIRSLIMPEGISSFFQVYVHEKGTNRSEKYKI
ncbi:SAM-dependent methyltransferase [Bacillus sp. PAMC26568]|nr:SAM-dependent methyltransferase [Bacillus sp. PAMC26568]